MKLVTYDVGGTPRAGLAVSGMIADLEKGARALRIGRLPSSTRALLEDGAAATRRAERLARKATQLAESVASAKARRPAWLVPEEAVHLGPPVPDPEKIICLGLNYLDHCREQEGRFGRPIEPPPHPIIFSKFPSALTGPYDAIRLPPPRVTRQVDYEVELAMVVGRTAKGVAQKDAMDYVAGFMVLNDVSARDCQFADGQWVRAKSFDTFAPCGPWLTTRDEVPQPSRLRLWTALNGQTMQDSSTRHFIFKPARVIAFLSRAMTLRPGDLISTGTPAGVGIFRDPPVTLGPGDTVECGIEGLGTLCNTCERA